MASYHLRLKNDSKPNGTKVSAKGHADYILREEDRQKRAEYIAGHSELESDCVFKGCQLPSWAKGSAQKFFGAATRYEDKGNRRFKEIEFSLPNELNLEQNREIVDKFIEAYLKNHYYAYAVHEKTGAISGERHPHVHIMFSERLIDDVERMKERPASKYFSRAAKPLKDEKVASFERRREHGAPKDKRWHSKKYLCKIREDFAKIQNEVLESNGFSIRVDHRTLKAQKLDAAENGDEFLSKVFDRVAESYMGIIALHSEDEVSGDLKRTRDVWQRKFDNLFRADFNEKILLEEQVKEKVRRAEMATLSMIRSKSYTTANFENEQLQTLNKKILSEFEKIKILKKHLMTGRRAKEKAQSEYLSKADRILLREYENYLAQKYNLESLLNELIEPNEKQPQNLQAFREIASGVRSKILSLKNSLVKMYPQFLAVEEKMKNPYRRKNVQLITHSILQRNLETLNELRNSGEQLLRYVQEFQNLTESKEQSKIIFTLSEVKENLRQQCRFLKSEYEKSEDEKISLMWKVIHPARAISMAQNIFVKGGFKKLREEKRKYEKASTDLNLRFSKYQRREDFFKSANWTSNAEKIQEQYYLTKEKILLKSEQQKLQKTKKFLNSESERLEEICKTDEARQKISVIAAGILKKNLKIALEYEKAKVRSKNLLQKLKLAKTRLEGLQENCPRKLQNKFFRVIPVGEDSGKNLVKDKNLISEIIADLLNGEQNAVQLVAYSSGNSLEMEKDWELMSELDKDEIRQKRIYREL